MRANSVGLETEISELNIEEIRNIGKGGIQGVLEFKDIFERTSRKIPYSLRYTPKQRELVEVKCSPEDVYFGNVENINFSINSTYYDWLIDLGKAEGARFFGTTGKLSLYSESFRKY